MAYKVLALICLQAVLLQQALSFPTSKSSNVPVTTSVVPSTVLSGTASQLVAPGFSPNWPASAQNVPLVTEILPSLQLGEMSVDGEMPVGGMIKITGTFPVFGNIAVDGSVPSHGTAYVDTANVFANECACFN
ncbi:uncharacterized protein LOC135085048 [Ostrinia nubilalis]|uniref:uncharacterized protein LOC135085048 n=1 Tax=Ostrinia nubilalis TaxID=29057 RepID=UPI00308239D1